MLIGLLGCKETGKSTVAKYLVSEYFFVERAFADPLKKACMELFSLDYDQVYGDIKIKETPDSRWFNCTPRKMLQFVGTDLLRNQMNQLIPEVEKDIFVHTFRLWYEKNKSKNVVVSDVRFSNEVELIHSLGGIVIKIERKTNNNDVHESELEITKITNYDALVENNSSIDELYSKIDMIKEKYNIQ